MPVTDASSYARIYLTTNWNHKRNERRENVKRIYKWEYYIIIYNVLCLFCKNEPPVLGPEVCYILNRSTKYFFREYIEVRKKVLPWFEANKCDLWWTWHVIEMGRICTDTLIFRIWSRSSKSPANCVKVIQTKGDLSHKLSMICDDLDMTLKWDWHTHNIFFFKNNGYIHGMLMDS